MRYSFVVLAFLSLNIGGAFALDSSTTNTGLGWSSCNVRQCKNRCIDTYGPTGGPVQTCKKLCDLDACNVVFNLKKGTVKILQENPSVLAPNN